MMEKCLTEINSNQNPLLTTFNSRNKVAAIEIYLSSLEVVMNI